MMIQIETAVQLAWNRAIAKVKAMTDSDLLAIWEALSHSGVWDDPQYNQHITLDEWAELIYSEITIHRGMALPAKTKTSQ